jgi:hypothetical protein
MESPAKLVAWKLEGNKVVKEAFQVFWKHNIRDIGTLSKITKCNLRW